MKKSLEAKESTGTFQTKMNQQPKSRGLKIFKPKVKNILKNLSKNFKSFNALRFHHLQRS